MSVQAPQLTRSNKTILVVMGALFLLHAIGQGVGAFSLVAWLGLAPEWFFPWRLHTLFTYPWVETQPMTLLFNALALWFLGSELERSWGPRVYLKFLGTCAVAAGLLYVAADTLVLRGTALGGGVLVGSAGVTYALCVAYAVLYPDRQFLVFFAFPVKARVFCLIMAGLELYMGVFSGNRAAWGHLFSMAIAFLLIRHQTWSPLAWWFRTGSAPSRRTSAKAKHLRLVDEDKDDKPKYWH